MIDIIIGRKEAKYLLIALTCGIINMLFSNNLYIELFFVGVQVIFVVYYILKNQIDNAIGLFTIFLSMSFEYSYTVGDFYGLKSFRFVGITIAVWIVFLFLLHSIFHSERYIMRSYQVQSWKKNVLYLNGIALVMGILMAIFNDNGIVNNAHFFSAFALEVYTLISLITIPLLVISHYVDKEEVRDKLKCAIIACLVATILQQYLSLILGITGNVTGQAVPKVSSIQLYGPFLMLFFLFPEKKYSRGLTVIGLLGYIISFKYSQGSGQYLMLFSIPVWMIIIALKRKKNDRLILLLGAGMVLAPIALWILTNGTVAVQYKLEQALAFLNISSKDWRMLMPMSARVRVEEIIDIFREYFEKPWLILFGKGIMGTIKDHTGYLEASKWALGTSGFSQFEWDANLYYSVHETLNKLLLMNGVFGIVVLIKSLTNAIKGSKYSVYIVIGMMWFIWYWGYSTTISWFGMTCMFVGLSEMNNDEEVSYVR